MAHHLPARDDYVEMIGRARAATADALEQAKRSGNDTVALLYQKQLTDWDRLIARLRENTPLTQRRPRGLQTRG
jgi:hypothetical protein